LVFVAAFAGAALLAACGDQPDEEAPGQTDTSAAAAPATPPTTVVERSHTADLTTTDGHRYRITMLVGPRSPTGTAEACPGAPTPGRAYLPVTLTVTNAAVDRTAPFPPVRIELTAGAGSKPGQVQLRDPAGSCTFSPRVPSIAPGASVVFRGTSPAIDEAAAAGSAGQIEVKVSETTFSLMAPVP